MASAATAQHAFYRDVLNLMNNSQIPYLVGGGYALDYYTGIARDSKDLDLVLEPAHARAILKLFSAHGYRTELCFPHWLGKVFGGDDVVDIIFSSGNGLCRVDNDWFEHAASGDILGVMVKLCPAEELIWTKGFIMERERYDGADIAHLADARRTTRLVEVAPTLRFTLAGSSQPLDPFRFHLPSGTKARALLGD